MTELEIDEINKMLRELAEQQQQEQNIEDTNNGTQEET